MDIAFVLSFSDTAFAMKVSDSGCVRAKPIPPMTVLAITVTKLLGGLTTRRRLPAAERERPTRSGRAVPFFATEGITKTNTKSMTKAFAAGKIAVLPPGEEKPRERR